MRLAADLYARRALRPANLRTVASEKAHDWHPPACEGRQATRGVGYAEDQGLGPETVGCGSEASSGEPTQGPPAPRDRLLEGPRATGGGGAETRRPLRRDPRNSYTGKRRAPVFTTR